MSIANELSCDVAAAMLARRDDAVEADQKNLSDIVLEVHTTLRQMTNEARRKRRDARFLRPSSPASNTAVSGNH